jgi:hypothetical protein
MTNNKLYGYTPKTSNEKDGNRLDRLNPYEFRKGMDYELVSIGCSRLAESTLEERETATEKVIKNLQEYGGYYSALIQYETEYRNPVEGVSKPSFKTYLKEMQDYQMIEVNKTYSNDKMTEPKYKKEDYTTQFKTDKMGKFKLKALKESIKKEILKNLSEAKTLSEIENKGWKKFKKKIGLGKAMANCTTPCPGKDSGFTGSGCPKCGAPGNVGKSNEAKKKTFSTQDDAPKSNEKAGCCACGDGTCTHACCGGAWPPSTPKGKSKKSKSTLSKSETVSAIAEAIKNLKEAKSDVYDMDDAEPTKSQIKGIDKSIGDAKEALAQAIKKIKELGPDIKKLAKETNDKIKKNPAGKADYLKTYTTNPDVKEFIKLRKMLKSADLL